MAVEELGPDPEQWGNIVDLTVGQQGEHPKGPRYGTAEDG
jgi:hypothetical protein